MPQVQPAPPPPPSGSSAGLIITLVIFGVLLLAGTAVGGYFIWQSIHSDDGGQTAQETTTQTTTESSATTSPETDSAKVGFSSPEEAVEAEAGGMVYDMLGDYGDSMEFVVGPSASEYTDVLVVERQSDGSWLVTRTYAYDAWSPGGGGGTSGGSSAPFSQAMAPEDEATSIVGKFLYAIKQDQADEAHGYTVSPFSEDPASAQYSNGDLKSFEIVSAVLQPDGTVRVRSREVWAWGTEEYIYLCTPTDNGYRIYELELP